jgi:predicted enzyme related to lactoylglutathione lyase
LTLNRTHAPRNGTASRSNFEIVGGDPDKLRNYYADLFGWEFDAPSTVAPEISDPNN